MRKDDLDLAELGRIPLSLRIGVSGHLWIPSTDDRIRAVIDDVLTRLMVLANKGTPATPVTCTVISSLAEGADRAVAHAALSRNARLEVVLPMDVQSYLDDFGTRASREEFAALLSRADSVTVLPGQDSRPKSYLAAGKAVVDRSDILLALWDAGPPGGEGGTNSTVSYAEQVHVPTRIIRAEPGPPVTLVAPQLTEPVGPLGPAAFAGLDDYNRRSLTRAEQQKAREALADSDGADWWPYYLRADLLAGRYQRRHRRLAALMYALAATAVAIAGLAVFDLPGRSAGAEVVVLAVLVATFVWARRQHFLSHWTAARFVAERLRSAVTFAAVGAVPSFASEPGGTSDDQSRGNWTARGVRELWYRLAPAAVDVEPNAAAERLRYELVSPQIEYHRTALRKADRQRRRTRRITVGLFSLSLVAALTHALELGWVGSGALRCAEYFSIVAPAVAAALAGYADQRDYPRQIWRSRRVLNELTSIRDELRHSGRAQKTDVVAAQIDRLVYADATEWFITASVHDLELPA